MQVKFSFFIFCVVCLTGQAQKYSFVNWTVEDGLIQSQASYICQDKYRQLWIGTEGGLSSFDGKKFTSYTVKNGLGANRINTMLPGREGKLWLGTSQGITVFDGSRFSNVVSEHAFNGAVQQIQQSDDGSVYALVDLKLLRINGNYVQKISITGDSTEKVTALSRNAAGSMMVYVYKKGLYLLGSSGKKLLRKFPQDDKFTVLRFFVGSGGDTLLLLNSGLARLNKGVFSAFGPGELGREQPHVMCIAEDANHRLWLGTDKGAYRLDGDRWQHFAEKNGFTDNPVNHIFLDAENNLWFATNADGIFKFNDQAFTYYDKSSGLDNPVVMGIAAGKKQRVFVAGYGGGLYSIQNDHSMQAVKDQPPVLLSARINCLYTDHDSSIWIGTQTKGIWQYKDNKHFKLLRPAHSNKSIPPGATVFLRTRAGELFIGTNQGLFVYDTTGKIIRIDVPEPFITSLLNYDQHQVLAGTSKGIYLISADKLATVFKPAKLPQIPVLCMSLRNQFLWAGTSDQGVICYDLKKDSVSLYSSEQGLPGDFIYSIGAYGNQSVWIGTGFGISHLRLKTNGYVSAIKNYGRSDGLLGMECNHNSILRTRDSSLWFGTTKGLFKFNPGNSANENNQPMVHLRAVKLFSETITDSSLFAEMQPWFQVPQGLRLRAKQNHLTFELASIFFTNPEDVLYRYMLKGADKDFSTGSNPYLIYPSLAPGIYTLEVTALTRGGIRSVNAISYTFEIRKAFYQTGFFQLLVIIILLGTGALLAWIFTRGRQKQRQKEKELHERIREEEFLKLRQRTAEDFHDELGNSLTRITVLADILKTKLGGKDEEVKGLLRQITENTARLYNGSRDIIWSLNARNDGIFEICEHLKQIGHELFSDTGLEFSFTHNAEPGSKLKLKLDYSRNITMIFKEICSNILKHASARNVRAVLSVADGQSFRLTVSDDGSGFEEAKITEGNGLRNISSRVSRMNGEIKIVTVKGKGTEIDILLKDIFSN